VAGFCGNGNEFSGCVTGRDTIDLLSDYWLLNVDCTP
jgi:hypothetical protein